MLHNKQVCPDRCSMRNACAWCFSCIHFFMVLMNRKHTSILFLHNSKAPTQVFSLILVDWASTGDEGGLGCREFKHFNRNYICFTFLLRRVKMSAVNAVYAFTSSRKLHVFKQVGFLFLLLTSNYKYCNKLS